VPLLVFRITLAKYFDFKTSFTVAVSDELWRIEKTVKKLPSLLKFVAD